MPALGAVESALDVVNGFRDHPAGRLRLNVPLSVSKLILPRITPPFIAAYPDICLVIIVDDSFVDLLHSGCDAGVRYEEHMELEGGGGVGRQRPLAALSRSALSAGALCALADFIPTMRW
ncbi:LysR substrate binding domain protein [Duganella sp. HH101]|nr:LysR substrate binding domain protein [Duganella sp. HH101]